LQREAVGVQLSRGQPDREHVGTIWDHLNELSARLRWVLYSLIATTIFFMVFPANSSFLQNPLAFYDPIIALVLQQVVRDVLPKGVTLIAGEITAPLEIYLIGSFVLGIAASTPILAYEIYKYVDPALYPEERRAVSPFMTSFTILFIIGAVFGYRILAPFMIWAMIPFFSIAGATPLIYALDFYNLVFVTTLATGFAFTLPVFFVLLVRFGILKTSYVTTRRRYIYAVMYVVTAVVTPDGGPIADVALFVPMAVLLEIAVLFGKRYEKNRPESFRPLLEKRSYPKCKFCGALQTASSGFCPSCGKAQT
jgi:sec-independent protein translocase protein TatC